ncbi:hypothetical protein [Sphingobium yanoikuyae]|jgi:hypothetical protein|uniref:Uncharacterized protein n=1 Tax=Sphingobium yanoikuyae TaxID=13690 RepID=A0A0J9FKP9_SPHYA|nr:hypothetical protein [Sphingobium yanoikuyae]ATP20388.1 hypothetical protein BV87_19740 [Sphingobium yanoikuyae]KMW29020.1 hypothetical protein BV87_16225 [Sphingobium yanoikuyae]MDH2129884.1 hypothetical protein [Sphingobium yanoikuyae]MDH2147878.1 hypothetical protein [Sphingobium yanoikuyae]MDH2165147.1 hypothetical protein [Sphingobium yanoikuyae]
MALSADEIAQIGVRLAAYQAAELAVLRNQSYRMEDGRELTRASLKEIRAGIESLRSELANAIGNPIVRGRMRRGTVVGR